MIALALAVVLVLVVASFVGLIRSESRAHARERDLMLNQLLNLAGKPWLPAPANNEPVDEIDYQAFYAVAPEQAPEDFDWTE